MGRDRKISFEVEYPVIDQDTLAGLPQEKFRQVWSSLGKEGWGISSDPVNGLATGVFRQIRAQEDCLNPNQSISTDTGPLIEIVPHPETTLTALKEQFSDLKKLVLRQVDSVGGKVLGLGIHPYTGDGRAEYYQLRTPRSAYDYAIERRGWPHEKLLNIAAIQEVIDVPVAESLRVFRILIRLGGLMIFIFRNAPDLHQRSGYLCVRPRKWKESVTSLIPQFKTDIHKVNIPTREILGWQDYFDLLWNVNPMFLLGTKKHGLFYIPAHPSFWDFLSQVPGRGWQGIDISGKEITVRPVLDHVNFTDWTYFGLCRPRWQFSQETNLDELVKAFHSGEIGPFFERYATKIIIENRFNATGFPGEEFCSLAFVLGILENLDVAEQFTFQYGYRFWQKVFSLAQTEPLSQAKVGSRRILPLAEEVVSIAREGLIKRGLGEEVFLEPAERIVHSGVSRSELTLELFNSAGSSKRDKALSLISKFTVS